MSDLFEVQDMLNEARMLNQALFLAAESFDRQKAGPLTCLCDAIGQKLEGGGRP